MGSEGPAEPASGGPGAGAGPGLGLRRRGCRRVRLLCMLALTFVFFVVEVAVSRLTASLAMLSDSFHMLSDVMALVVALVAVRFAQRTRATKKNTFGWVRAEVMGALVNAVFLTALCFTIFLEAVERFTVPHEIQQPIVVITVGAAGLLVNLLGLCLFHQHGHGHGHSHGGHRHRSAPRGKAELTPEDPHRGEETNTLVEKGSSSSWRTAPENGVSLEKMGEWRGYSEVSPLQPTGPNSGDMVGDRHLELQPNGNISKESLEMDVDVDTSGQLNMRGVFLHVLGDALGSVIVVVNALVFYSYWTPCPNDGPCFNPCVDDDCANATYDFARMNATELQNIPVAGPCWVLYLDPALCLIMVCILLYTTYPLLKESALILLQTVPKQIDIRSLNEKLRKLEGVEAIHELHVWQLAGSRIIGTAHIKCLDPESYMKVAKQIKEIFHDEGIHATTIQPEFPMGSDVFKSKCELPCRTQCALKQCCETAAKTITKKPEKSSLISISCSEIVIDSTYPKNRRTTSESILGVKLEEETDSVKLEKETVKLEEETVRLEEETDSIKLEEETVKPEEETDSVKLEEETMKLERETALESSL